MFIFKHPHFLSDISGVLKILLLHVPLKPPKTVSLAPTLSAPPGLRVHCFVVFTFCWIAHTCISVPTLWLFLRPEIRSPEPAAPWCSLRTCRCGIFPKCAPHVHPCAFALLFSAYYPELAPLPRPAQSQNVQSSPPVQGKEHRLRGATPRAAAHTALPQFL